jgi:hypothetical protein
MPAREHRTETHYVTANSAEDAQNRLVEHLASREPNGSVFDDEDEAVKAASEARRWMHLTGNVVYVVTIEIASH